MEFQILDALGSTPRSLRILTPIIFSHYFASIVKMNYSPHEHDALFCEIIVQCQSEYWVAKLRPSLIAALGALALEKNQFITEDEFICYFPEMLKLFQKLKIDKEHRPVFDFPIKWKNNIKCASRFLIFTNMRIIEQPNIASQGVGIMPKSSLILKAISLIMILGSLYCIIKIINERWETKKTSSQLLRMNKYVIGVAVNDEDVDDSDDLSADNNDDNWYLASTLELAEIFKVKLSNKFEKMRKWGEMDEQWEEYSRVSQETLTRAHICIATLNTSTKIVSDMGYKKEYRLGDYSHCNKIKSCLIHGKVSSSFSQKHLNDSVTEFFLIVQKLEI
ncbi:hypothetical protein G4B88_011020 [Cannabis sativa]|uniref:Uncharacterized protein n=1 Tax=Cannabis sativa TaxID=3483 RepID=A0A7J6HJZ5_CANSA|nr:hypothetical protein G4B88_011020 [Cannabis sativa]